MGIKSRVAVLLLASVGIVSAFHSKRLGASTTANGQKKRLVSSPIGSDSGFDPAALSNIAHPFHVSKNKKKKSSALLTDPSSSLRLVAGVTFNAVKAMLGTGMLALPMGLAVISDHKSALLPGSILLATLGALSAYTFALYGRLINATKAQSLGEIWRIVGKDDKRDTSGVITVANFILCFGSCLAFSLILGDIFSSLAQGMITGVPSWAVSRQAAIMALTTFLLFPLCKLKSLASLTPFSLIGVIGSLITIGFLGLRCPALVASSPYAEGGIWAAKATFGTYARPFSPAPLTLVSMSCIALMAHFSAPEFYHALVPTSPNGATATPTKSPNNDTSTLRNYFKVTLASFSIVALVNTFSLAFGFLTFGAESSGNILNNYSLKDAGASLSRLLVGLSLIGSFPMCMRPCQTNGLELLGMEPTEKNKFRMMTGLLSVITALALTVKNVGLVLSLNGSLIGTNLVYTIPSLLFLKLTKARVPTRSLKLERALCRILVVFGLVAMIAGSTTSIVATFYPHLMS